MALSTATRRKAKTEKPIREVDRGECLGFFWTISRDPNDDTYPMHIDGDQIGFAYGVDEARLTISEWCQSNAELAKSAIELDGGSNPDQIANEYAADLETRATTADMTADAAANVDEELAGQGLRRASDDEAGWWVRMSNGTKVWATDAPPRSAPTWTNDKIAAGLAPDASDDDRSLALALSNLRARAQNDCPCGSSCPCCDPSHPEAVEQRIEREEAENTDPDLDSAPPNRDALAAALEDAGTAAEPWHRAAWREDWHQRHPATPAHAASAQTPPTPPRTVSELQEELERVTDAIHDRKAVGAGYARLHQQRSRIIAELDAAHKVEHKAAIKPCFTCGRQFISKGPRDILCSLCACPASGANTKSIAPANPLDADISTLGLSPEIERLLVGTPNPICSVCGAPATISFAHTWFCQVHKPCIDYAALSDAASVEPWIAQPAPSCGNCGQPHSTQRCPEVLALLLGDSDTVEVAAEGFALTKGFCRDALYTPEPVPVWLNALPSDDDPCAGVRGQLDTLRRIDQEILARWDDEEGDAEWFVVAIEPLIDELRTALKG